MELGQDPATQAGDCGRAARTATQGKVEKALTGVKRLTPVSRAVGLVYSQQIFVSI